MDDKIECVIELITAAKDNQAKVLQYEKAIKNVKANMMLLNLSIKTEVLNDDFVFNSIGKILKELEEDVKGAKEQ